MNLYEFRTKFTTLNLEQILCDFTSNLYEIRTNFVATDCEVFIHTMGKSGEFVRNSHKLRTNFTPISTNLVTLCIGTVEYCVKPSPFPQGFFHTQWGVVTGHSPSSGSIS